MTDPRAIGDRFAATLREWLTPAEVAQMRARNATAAYAGACASHDYCDANFAMEQHMPPCPDDGTPEHETYCALWNAAWAHARAHHLTDKA